MKCKTIHKKLIFFIEGDLPEKEMQGVGEHLSRCNECVAFAEEMKKILGVVHLEKPAPASPFFYTRLKARMAKQEEADYHLRSISIWQRVLQPALFSILLMAGIYSGIKIGEKANVEIASPVYAEMEVVPFLNEVQSEPIESFLME